MLPPGRDSTDALQGLDAEQRAWAERSERRWRLAHAIATERPDLDAGDVYHALRCLELTPAERLRRGLTRGRLGAHRR